MKRDNTKLIYALLSLLIVTVAVQSYFLYDLKKSKNFQTKKEVVVDNFFKHPYTNSTDPFKEIKKMQEDMQKSFGHINSIFSNDPFFKDVYKELSVSPLSDFKENKKNYIIELNIPGANEQKIDIKSQNHIIKIYAKSTKNNDTKDTNYLHRERYTQVFERNFVMPDNADLNKLKSIYKNGILKITIPKKDK